ncbi:hypothetical protein [Tunturiibacter lichenicola]|uniref:hypothetical protein n=1 Tax=Tunturiibacter lichenicola TaxID=2051959 RepID=UPI003D9B9103
MHTSNRRHLLRAQATAILVLLLFASLFTRAAVAPAQPPLTVEGLGKPTVALDGTWQFHTGDDPAWASPNLDDSQWESIQTDKPWGAQQHFGYTGYAWYRRHIDFAPGPSDKLDLSLAVGYVSDVYEIYWNGTKIGGYGTMPPHYRSYWGGLPQVYSLGKPQPGVLACGITFPPPLTQVQAAASMPLPALEPPTRSRLCLQAVIISGSKAVSTPSQLFFSMVWSPSWACWRGCRTEAGDSSSGCRSLPSLQSCWRSSEAFASLSPPTS